MAKISKQGKALVKSIAEFVGKDNQQIVEVVEKIDIYVQENKKAFDELSELEHQDLSEPTRLLRQVAEVFYSQTKLKNVVVRNSQRIPGNLAEKDKLLALYDTFEQFDYTCPYSDTLLISVFHCFNHVVDCIISCFIVINKQFILINIIEIINNFIFWFSVIYF